MSLSDAICGFTKANLRPTTTVERSLLETPAARQTRWVRTSDGKWREQEVEDVAMGSAAELHQMQAPIYEMHGQCYGFEKLRNGWAPPRCTFVSENAARPGYDSSDASEYCDTDETLAAKVAQMAALVRAAKCCVVYAGAGLSTSAGIADYATQSPASSSAISTIPSPSDSAVDEQRAFERSPMCAQPTESHRVLVSMHAAGWIHRLVQQNHDGLPQKAGMPQQALNEIHGALHAPDNPVIPMSGMLRDDLLQDLLECERRADLVLAVGTSLAGMNADRVVHTCAARAGHGSARAGGTVLVGLQRTRYDGEATLRLFATCDRVFRLLAEALGLSERVPPARPRGSFFTPPVLLRHRSSQDLPPELAAGAADEANSDGSCKDGIDEANYLLCGVAYDAMGRRLADAPGGAASIDLDMREGASLVIPSGMHAGAAGTVEGVDREGHVKVRWLLRVKKTKGSFKAPMMMVVGTWWLQAAADAAVEQLPVVNVPTDGDASDAANELRALREAYG